MTILGSYDTFFGIKRAEANHRVIYCHRKPRFTAIYYFKEKNQSLQQPTILIVSESSMLI